MTKYTLKDRLKWNFPFGEQSVYVNPLDYPKALESITADLIDTVRTLSKYPGFGHEHTYVDVDELHKAIREYTGVKK